MVYGAKFMLQLTAQHRLLLAVKVVNQAVFHPKEIMIYSYLLSQKQRC